MSKISQYPSDSLISGGDKFIGSDADSGNQTKNFTVADLFAWILSQCGSSNLSAVNLALSGSLTIIGNTEGQAATFTTMNLTVPTYDDDAAAGAGGLTSGDLYKTVGGGLRIKL